MPDETSTKDPQQVARKLLEKGSFTATDTLEVLLTNVPELEGKKHRQVKLLFVPNTALEEAGMPVPTRGQDTTRLGPLEAHFAGSDDKGVAHSSFEMQKVQMIAGVPVDKDAHAESTGGLEQVVRADLQKSKAYLVNVTDEGMLLMPPPTEVAGRYLDDLGLSDARLIRRGAMPGEGDQVIHDSLAIETNKVSELLHRFPEITDLTGRGEISLQQLEQIEAERSKQRGRQGGGN